MRRQAGVITRGRAGTATLLSRPRPSVPLINADRSQVTGQRDLPRGHGATPEGISNDGHSVGSAWSAVTVPGIAWTPLAAEVPYGHPPRVTTSRSAAGTAGPLGMAFLPEDKLAIARRLAEANRGVGSDVCRSSKGRGCQPSPARLPYLTRRRATSNAAAMSSESPSRSSMACANSCALAPPTSAGSPSSSAASLARRASLTPFVRFPCTG